MQIRGFSLVELSIVLVILGLLVGGILAGQSLIRASELRSVVTAMERYQVAAHAFRDKYFAVPGDMATATAIWGKDNTACSTHTGTANANGTCNGNANGQVDYSSTANWTGESWEFWRHLALAGLIEGKYNGMAASGTPAVPDVNAPRSRINAGVWAVAYRDATPSGDVWEFGINFGNRMTLMQPTGGGVVTPAEAWNMDVKLDDGMPATGRFIAVLRNNCTNSSSGTDWAAPYRLTNTSITACGLAWKNAI